jgi:GGDEF domain-containing protein
VGRAIKHSPKDYPPLSKICINVSLGNIDWAVRIFYPGASIGVVEINPDSIDADSALRIADQAMYQDKNGKNKSRFYASINSLQGVFCLRIILFSSI